MYECNNVLLHAVVVPTISELSPESGWTKVTEGESVQLTCRATGKPDPVITWTHRQRELDSNVIISFSAFLAFAGPR